MSFFCLKNPIGLESEPLMLPDNLKKVKGLHNTKPTVLVGLHLK